MGGERVLQVEVDWLKKNNRTSAMSVVERKQRREGRGKPERLRYFEKEVYSRRVNHKDRLIYPKLSG